MPVFFLVVGFVLGCVVATGFWWLLLWMGLHE